MDPIGAKLATVSFFLIYVSAYESISCPSAHTPRASSLTFAAGSSAHRALGATGMMSRPWLLLATICQATANDLSYPTPPNPFAKPGASGPQPPSGLPQQGIVPPGASAQPPPPLPSDEAASPLLPGGIDDAGASAGDAGGGLLPGGEDVFGGDAMRPPLPPGGPPGGGDGGGGGGGVSASDADALPSRIPSRDELGVGKGLAQPAAARSSVLRWRPALCLAGLSAACMITRPREASLLTAIDGAHDAFGHVLDAGLKSEPLDFYDCGLACVGVHSDLIWLGMLGQWLPLLPASLGALDAWKSLVGAPQVLMLALTFGYLLRKLLPRSFTDAHLSASSKSLARPHALLLSAMSPAGLVHWLHMCCVLLACSSGSFDETIGRKRLVLLYAAAGACASVACALSQLVLGRGRPRPRSTASGAAMALLLLRSAAMPEVRPVPSALLRPPGAPIPCKPCVVAAVRR
jgi:membrane associated rhomboid family serine protease